MHNCVIVGTYGILPPCTLVRWLETSYEVSVNTIIELHMRQLHGTLFLSLFDHYFTLTTFHVNFTESHNLVLSNSYLSTKCLPVFVPQNQSLVVAELIQIKAIKKWSNVHATATWITYIFDHVSHGYENNFKYAFQLPTLVPPPPPL